MFISTQSIKLGDRERKWRFCQMMVTLYVYLNPGQNTTWERKRNRNLDEPKANSGFFFCPPVLTLIIQMKATLYLF